MRSFSIVMLVLLAAPLMAQESHDSLVIEIAGHNTVLHSLAGLPRDTALAQYLIVEASTTGDAHGARSVRMVTAIRVRDP